MSIYEYDDYRDFLRDYIASLPKHGYGEINRMAQHLEVHPSLLSQVLRKSKDLNLEQAQLVCEYLGLKNEHSDMFFCLVQISRAGTQKLRDYFKENAQKLRDQESLVSPTTHPEMTEEDKALFYSHWHYMTAWLLSSIKDGITLKEVENYLKTSEERASNILRMLSRAHLIEVKDSKYVAAPRSINLPRGSSYTYRHHANWRFRAIESCDKITQDETIFTSPMSISKADFKKAQSILKNAIQRITNLALEGEPDDVACLNVDLFWVKKW